MMCANNNIYHAGSGIDLLKQKVKQKGRMSRSNNIKVTISTSLSLCQLHQCAPYTFGEANGGSE